MLNQSSLVTILVGLGARPWMAVIERHAREDNDLARAGMAVMRLPAPGVNRSLVTKIEVHSDVIRIPFPVDQMTWSCGCLDGVECIGKTNCNELMLKDDKNYSTES